MSSLFDEKQRRGDGKDVEEEATTHPWMMMKAVSSRDSPSQAFKQVMESPNNTAQFTWFLKMPKTNRPIGHGAKPLES